MPHRPIRSIDELLPGRVTITSPAMIEGSKTTITNEAGRYIFVDLRPGTYEVTFELKGFTTVKKPGVLVTAGFTAPVNAVLKIAAMEQTLAVEAAPPLVDVQSIANTRVQTREELDAIPTKSGDQQSLALTIPGTAFYGFGEVAYHGTNDGLTAVDGIRSTVISVGGVSFSGSFSNEQFQEMSFTTAMESAEMGRPGMMINLIPRDGGNEFRGSLFFNFTTARFNDSNTFSPSLSYVTGSHVLKAGLRYFRGSYFHPQGVVGGVDLVFIAGTPTTAILGGFFPPLTKPKINGDYGWFVQDKWTIKRLTLNLGLRMDHLMSSQQAIDLPATALLVRIRTPEEDILNWKDLSPRIGASLDLFGNAKTSVKFGLARFVVGETQGATNSYSTISKYDTAFIFAPWNDKNGDRTIFNPDGTVQWDPTLPPFAAFMPDNPSELVVFDPNYGKVVESKQIDPELKRGWFKRGYSWEYNIGAQHELTSRPALNFLFYRRWNGNGVLTDDRAIEATSAYYNGPFCISRPADPRLPGGGGGQICGLYDTKPEHVNHVPDNYRTFAKKLLGRDLPNYIQGFDITVNGRFVKGVFLQGGLTVIKSYRDNTLLTTLDNPEFQYPIRETPYNAQIKFNGQYTLPWQIAVSGSYSMLRGPEISYDWPSAPVGFTLSNGMTTRDVLVSEPSREYYPFVHQADLRFGKVFKVNERYSFKPSVDFYNIFNSDGITAIGSSYAPPGTPGSNWRVPTGIVQPRQFRITAQLQF